MTSAFYAGMMCVRPTIIRNMRFMEVFPPSECKTFQNQLLFQGFETFLKIENYKCFYIKVEPLCHCFTFL